MSACVHRKPEYSACNSRRCRKECVTELRVCLILECAVGGRRRRIECVSMSACVHRKPEYFACNSRRRRKECVTELRVCLILECVSFLASQRVSTGSRNILRVVAGVTGKRVSQR